MALYTEIVRDGETLNLGVGWSWWHLARLTDAMEDEDGCCRVNDYPYGYVFLRGHSYSELETHIWRDGIPGATYIFEIKAGDVYNVWHGR